MLDLLIGEWAVLTKMGIALAGSGNMNRKVRCMVCRPAGVCGLSWLGPARLSKLNLGSKSVDDRFNKTAILSRNSVSQLKQSPGINYLTMPPRVRNKF